MNTPSPKETQAIIVTAERVGHDGRGMIFTGKATLGEIVVEATGHNPICDTLRAFLLAHPEFDDAPWQLVRGDRIDCKGGSARKMAKLYVAEDGRGTRLRARKDSEIAPIYRASCPGGTA